MQKVGAQNRGPEQSKKERPVSVIRNQGQWGQEVTVPATPTISRKIRKIAWKLRRFTLACRLASVIFDEAFQMLKSMQQDTIFVNAMSAVELQSLLQETWESTSPVN